jgi:prevent-host-death family protein
MATEIVELDDARARLTELLDKAAGGTEVIISERGAPRARLVAVEGSADPPGKRVAGLHRGAIVMGDDFDAPLPDEFWLGDGAKPE